MPMDPQAQVILDLVNASGFGDISEMEPTDVRALMASLSAPSTVHVDRVENRTIPGPAGEIPVRIYGPAAETPLPVLVWYHGGGWVIGSLETHDGICRELVDAAGCIVVSVDYRLAPEHRFPAGLDDAYAAACWVSDHASEIGADPSRVAVGGDSAGGHLAAVTAMLARDRGAPPLVFQLLVYPALEYEFERPSMIENAAGYMLTTEGMRWFYRHTLNDASEGDDPRVSPIRAESLTGLPPAFVITAEFDPLRDQGIAYAEELEAAGVSVTCMTYDGVFHGFFNMQAMLDEAKVAVGDAVVALRDAFGS
ncbi:MAG: alpha/beta hydrolase [Acidimicrobiia bacterium]